MNIEQLKQQRDLLVAWVANLNEQIANFPVIPVKHKQWEPKGGDYFICADGRIEIVTSTDEFRLFGTERQTKEACEKDRPFINRHNLLLAYCAEFAPDYVPDWFDQNEDKCFPLFDYDGNEWVVRCNNYFENPASVYFPNDVCIDLVKKLNSGEVVL